MFVGFWLVDVPGVPPLKVQDHPVGVPVLLSVKLMQAPTQMLVLLAVKDATGGAPPVTDKVISSMAVEGSAPVPSVLFTQRNPIFTLGLLLAEGGRAIGAMAAHLPCPPVQLVSVFPGSLNCVQVAPSKYQTVMLSMLPCPP